MEESTKTVEEISQAFFSALSEKDRRLFAAQQSLERGYGGISSVHRQYGISINAIQRGRGELQEGRMLPSHRQRRVGGGRKSTLKTRPELSRAFAILLQATHCGQPAGRCSLDG